MGFMNFPLLEMDSMSRYEHGLNAASGHPVSYGSAMTEIFPVVPRPVSGRSGCKMARGQPVDKAPASRLLLHPDNQAA
jgi:hypothetical protein